MATIGKKRKFSSHDFYLLSDNFGNYKERDGKPKSSINNGGGPLKKNEWLSNEKDKKKVDM